MKYQSELIKEIVDTRGHKESSLHYESECVETWIEEAKGGYPKLCDYESEWLKYISILDDTGGSEDPEPPIGEFPYVVLSDVTEATIDNVVPYAYKSAILKGNTLVNVVSEQSFGGSNTLYESRFYNSPFNEGEKFTIFVVNPMVTTIKVGLYIAATGNWQREQQYNINNNKRVVYTVPSGNCCKYVGVVVRSSNDFTGFENSLVIMSGDKSNLEIENYFEGMQSVKMPVLTTSNEDGTKTNILTVNEDVTLRSNGDIYDELNLLNGRLTQRIDENNEVLAQEVVKTVDLNIQDQNGKTLSVIKPIEGKMFLSTSSDTIKPLFSGEIPVEAITQNLASFIDLEMEE